MKTIALVTQKGGTGKSTIAMHLAVCAARRGKTVALLDLDPQATVTQWAEVREESQRKAVAAALARGKKPPAEDPLDGAVISARAQELPGLLAAAKKQGADLVVLDTAGRLDITAAHAMELADIVLLPCRASFPDLKATLATVEQVKKARPKRVFFLLNAVPVQGARHVEAREALEGLLPVAPVELHQYVAYGDALNDGRSVEELDSKSRAALEIRALYDWAMKV